eukprot:COSAG01_NODE_1005_length_12174_cov_40.917267_6_plen_103_part_00
MVRLLLLLLEVVGGGGGCLLLLLLLLLPVGVVDGGGTSSFCAPPRANSSCNTDDGAGRVGSASVASSASSIVARGVAVRPLAIGLLHALASLYSVTVICDCD